MKTSGLADSPFFSAPRQESPSPPPSGKPSKEIEPSTGRGPAAGKRVTKQSSDHDTTTPRDRDTVVPWYHDAIIEQIRKAVKEFGKEAATHRFTLEEKKAIADVIYSYKRRGIRTSENEIARIAVNFVINDYRENGENSVLGKVLEVLNG